MTRTIIVHDKCTNAGCNKTLHSIVEGERGVCASCWFRKLPDATQKAMKSVISLAFKSGTTEQEKQLAVEDLNKRLNNEQSN